MRVVGHMLWELCCLTIQDYLLLLARRLSVCEQAFLSLVRGKTAFGRRCVGARWGNLESITPCDKRGVVDGIDNGTFEVGHHFHVVVIFHVVAFDDGNFSIHDHELCMKCSKEGLVKVDDFKVDMRNLFRLWQLDFFTGFLSVLVIFGNRLISREDLPGVHFWFDRLTIVDELGSAGLIIHDLDHHALAALTSSPR